MRVTNLISTFAIPLALSAALCVLMSAVSAQATLSRDGKYRSYVNINFLYNDYSPLTKKNTSAGLVSESLSPSESINLEFRFYRIFSLILAGGKSLDSKRTDAGVGARFDLPGFIIFGPKYRDFSRSAKLYPVNTSAYMLSSKSVVEDNGTIVSDAIATTYGISIDIFLFNNFVYLTGNYGVHSYLGDTYTVVSGGLGFDF